MKQVMLLCPLHVSDRCFSDSLSNVSQKTSGIFSTANLVHLETFFDYSFVPDMFNGSISRMGLYFAHP